MDTGLSMDAGMGRGPQIEVACESDLWSALPNAEALIARAVDASVAATQPWDAAAELSVLLCDDARIRTLNATWRGIDKPTNVLSFEQPGAPRPPLMGDIALAYETLAREAHDEGKTIADHFSHLVVHGFLHLCGYDHLTDAQAEAMEALERTILTSLGIADPYAGQETRTAG